MNINPEDKITEHFTWGEMYADSPTAKKLKIDNAPTEEHAKHLQELVETILEPLRLARGSGIKVSSAYRSWDLNNAVGGSKTSAHSVGYAADIKPSNGEIKEFKAFVKKWLRDNKVAFDQCIDEANLSGGSWMHIGLKNRTGKQRKQYLITKDAKTYKVDNWK